MKGSELYNSDNKYLKAEDLKNQEHELTIENYGVQEFNDGQQKKLTLSFVGKEKQLVLNKTNYSVIANALGDETDMWRGKNITIYPTVTDYAGKQVPCIRVRPVLAKADPNDGIPF